MTVASDAPVDQRTYHAHVALGSTDVKHLLIAPAVFKYVREHPSASTEAMELGTAVHSRVLGVGAQLRVLDFPDWRTNAAKAAREEARAAGYIPILEGDRFLQIRDMAEAILRDSEARTLIEAGLPECSVFATDPTTGTPIKALFDVLGDTGVDIKTTSGRADENTFRMTVKSFGYHIQQGHYLNVHDIARGSRPRFKFIVCESTAPYLVAVHELDEDYAWMGAREAEHAYEIWAECNSSGVWPGYESAHPITPPMGAIYDFQDRYGESA